MQDNKSERQIIEIKVSLWSRDTRSVLAFEDVFQSSHVEISSSVETIFGSAYRNCKTPSCRSIQRVSHNPDSWCPRISFKIFYLLADAVKKAIVAFMMPTAFLTAWTFDDCAIARFKTWL